MTGGCADPGDCREAVERLYFYLDGELTEERRELISRHLDECQPCLDAYGFEGELRAVIAQKCKDHVPDGLRERVASALDDEVVGGATSGVAPEA